MVLLLIFIWIALLVLAWSLQHTLMFPRYLIYADRVWPGPPDGVLGHRTVNAIRLYQKFGGLEITGHATPELLLDLRAVAARMPEPTG